MPSESGEKKGVIEKKGGGGRPGKTKVVHGERGL